MTNARSLELKGFLKSAGEKFRSARQEKRLTIGQVHKATHIHPNIISALEEGRADETLGPTYVKSYLKKYALFLGLNDDEMVKEYDSFHIVPAQQSLEMKSVDKLGGMNLALKYLPRVISGIAIALIAFGLIVMVGRLMQRAKTVAPRTTTAVSRSGTSKKKTAPMRAVAQKAARAEPASPAPSASPAKKSPNFIPVSVPAGEALRLVINVGKPVLLMAARDGEILFTNVLRAGARETVVGKDKITLWIADASAIELTLNGEYLGSPGKGEIKDLEITHKGIRITR